MNILGIVTVTGTGASVRATIPKDAAIVLGLSPGDRLVFTKNGTDEVIVQKNGGKL